MSSSKKNRATTHLLRIVMIISLGLPIIFNLLSKTSHKILWRKVDTDYFNCLRLLLQVTNANTKNIISNPELMCEMHVVFYKSAKEVLEFDDNKVGEFVRSQQIFLEKGVFSTSKYKEFLVKNNLSENVFLTIMKEICLVNLYRRFIIDKTKKAQSKTRDYLKKVLKNKKIISKKYSFNGKITRGSKPTTKEMKEVYDKEVIKKNSNLFTKREIHGYLISQDLFSLNPKDFKVTEKELSHYCADQSVINKLQDVKLTINMFIAEGDVNPGAIVRRFNDGEITKEDLESYGFVNKKIEVNNKTSEEFSSFYSIYNQLGLNKLVYIEENNLLFYVEKQEYNMPSNFRELAKEALMKSKIKNKIISHLLDLKTNLENLQIQASGSDSQKIKNSKLNLESHLSKIKNNKLYKVQEVSVDENNVERYHYIASLKDSQFIEEDGAIKVFFTVHESSGKLLSFKEVDKKLLTDIFFENQEQKIKEEILDKKIRELNDLQLKQSSTLTRKRDPWKEETIVLSISDVLILSRDKMEILFTNRYGVNKDVEDLSFFKHSVEIKDIELTPAQEKELERIIRILIEKMGLEEHISLSGKIKYYKDIAKHDNFITRYFVEIGQRLV